MNALERIVTHMQQAQHAQTLMRDYTLDGEGGVRGDLRAGVTQISSTQVKMGELHFLVFERCGQDLRS